MVRGWFMAALATAFALTLLGAPEAMAAQGIKGRTSLGGVLVEGVEIRAYAYRPGGFGPLSGEAPAASLTTGLDGTYSLELPPGRYVVEAIKKKEGNRSPRPEAGDVHCLYSGSPVTVAANRWTVVGLYLVTVAPEKRSPAPASRVTGRLVFKGEPVERAYLYAYASPEGAFRGPADVLQPVAKGTFSVNLPPGTYHLVARKRLRGGAYGPIDKGDLFNFYPRNPVVVKEGEEVALEIPLVERLSQLEAEEGDYRGLKVKVLDARGKPLSGQYVLAYAGAERMGPPQATSGPTDANGETFLSAPPDARYLRARASVGGPLGETETYADGEAPADAETGVVLTVRKK